MENHKKSDENPILHRKTNMNSDKNLGIRDREVKWQIYTIIVILLTPLYDIHAIGKFSKNSDEMARNILFDRSECLKPHAPVS